MKEEDAMGLAHKLDNLCSFQLQRHAPPIARSLKDFGIDREGFGIFCEGFRNYVSFLQRCIIFFMKPRRLQKKEIGNDAILYEK
jgi:hypothetical protein